jgi:hypothetical protein
MASPIQANDNSLDRFSKLLPADVTAAFISTKAALVAAVPAETQSGPIFWSFVLILLLCPPYFKYVSKIDNRWHRYFLVASAGVFAFALADKQIANVFIGVFGALDKNGTYLSAASVTPIVTGIAIVLPILWTLLVSQIAMSAISDKAIQSSLASPAAPVAV